MALPLTRETFPVELGVGFCFLPDALFPARATQGAGGGAVSRKKAREGCGQHGPSPLDAAPASATVAGQGRKEGVRQMPGREFDGMNCEASVIHSLGGNAVNNLRGRSASN